MTGRPDTTDDSFHTVNVLSILMYSYSAKVVLFALLEQLRRIAMINAFASHLAVSVGVQVFGDCLKC